MVSWVALYFHSYVNIYLFIKHSFVPMETSPLIKFMSRFDFFCIIDFLSQKINVNSDCFSNFLNVLMPTQSLLPCTCPLLPCTCYRAHAVVVMFTGSRSRSHVHMFTQSWLCSYVHTVMQSNVYMFTQSVV